MKLAFLSRTSELPTAQFCHLVPNRYNQSIQCCSPMIVLDKLRRPHARWTNQCAFYSVTIAVFSLMKRTSAVVGLSCFAGAPCPAFVIRQAVPPSNCLRTTCLCAGVCLSVEARAERSRIDAVNQAKGMIAGPQ